MDNLAHALVGAALGRAVADRHVPRAATIGIVAANAPDWAELFIGLPGTRAQFLELHRGITHSLAGAFVEIVALTLLIRGGWWLVYRWMQRRGREATPPPAWRWLALGMGAILVWTRGSATRRVVLAARPRALCGRSGSRDAASQHRNPAAGGAAVRHRRHVGSAHHRRCAVHLGSDVRECRHRRGSRLAAAAQPGSTSCQARNRHHDRRSRDRALRPLSGGRSRLDDED